MRGSMHKIGYRKLYGARSALEWNMPLGGKADSALHWRGSPLSSPPLLENSRLRGGEMHRPGTKMWRARRLQELRAAGPLIHGRRQASEEERAETRPPASLRTATSTCPWAAANPRDGPGWTQAVRPDRVSPRGRNLEVLARAGVQVRVASQRSQPPSAT